MRITAYIYAIQYIFVYFFFRRYSVFLERTQKCKEKKGLIYETKEKKMFWVVGTTSSLVSYLRPLSYLYIVNQREPVKLVVYLVYRRIDSFLSFIQIKRTSQ